MKKLSFLALLVAIVFAPVAHAQSPAASESVVPLIYARHLTVVAGNSTIKGAFTALSQEETNTVGGLQYEVLILSPEPPLKEDELTTDDPTVYTRTTLPDVFTLKPGESLQRTFTIATPSLPQADYRLRVQLKTANDREMGWADTPLTFGDAQSFVLLTPQIVDVTAAVPFSTEQRSSWGPLEGPNVTPQQPLALKLTAASSGSASITTPVTITTRRLFNQEPPATVQLPDPVIIPARATAQPLTIPLTAASVPGAYQVLVSLGPVDNHTVSTVAEFRYVVRGLSASVVRAALAEPIAYHAGQTAIADFMVVGSADQETIATGQLTVSVLDNGQVAGQATQPVELSASAVSGTASIILDKDITSHPVLKLSIAAPDGRLLAAYEVSYPAPTDASSASPPVAAGPPVSVLSPYIWGGIAAIIIVILAVSAWLLYRRRPRRLTLPPIPPPAGGPTTTALLIIAVLVAGYWLLVTAPAHANGIQYKFKITDHLPSHAIFVNEPAHNETVTAKTIKYTSRGVIVVCSNTGTGNMVFAVNTQKGKLSFPRYDNPSLLRLTNFNDLFKYGSNTALPNPFNSAWTTRGIKTLSFNKVTTETKYILSFSQKLPLPLTNAGDAATIWSKLSVGDYVAAGWGYKGPSTGSYIANIDDFTHVTYQPPTQCSDGIDNDGDGKVDAADPGCHTDGNASNPASYDPNDNDETDPPSKPQCDDKKDNDGDGLIDIADPGCHTDGDASNPSSWDSNDNDETNLPDLISRDLGPSSGSITAGDTITFSGTIQNTGQAPAGASQAQFFLNYPSPFGGPLLTGALAVNGTQSHVSGSWVATEGSHTIELCADNTGLVTESNELNNCSTRVSFTVAPAAVTNQAPTADFTFVPDAPATNQQVTFTDASSDPDGSIVSWSWNFGDSGTSTSQNPSHPYTAGGPYTVILTVTDDDGATATISKNVTVTDTTTPNDNNESNTNVGGVEEID